MSVPIDAVEHRDSQSLRAPDFFIVGHPKSGTSALFRMLSAHPRLHMPRKEPHFFVPELNSKRSRGTLQNYLELFSGAREDQLIGEATTSYLWSSGAAARIAEVQPEARIIAILREPASFLRSLHLQLLRGSVENVSDLREALALEERAPGRPAHPARIAPPAVAPVLGACPLRGAAAPLSRGVPAGAGARADL